MAEILLTDFHHIWNKCFSETAWLSLLAIRIRKQSTESEADAVLLYTRGTYKGPITRYIRYHKTQTSQAILSANKCVVCSIRQEIHMTNASKKIIMTNRGG